MSERVQLTTEGAARRTAILDQALHAQRRRVQRRRTTAGAGAMLGVGAAITLAMLGAPGAPAPERPAMTTVQLVETTPDAYDALAVASSSTSVERISDEELLELLSGEGRSPGIVRTQGRVRVIGVEFDPIDEDDAGSSG